MNYRVLMVSLFAAMPVLVCAQETKLVNCRTLEAAGNFIGPDEVLDSNNMVCQKVRAGAAAPSNPLPLKPVPGVVISNTEPANVVEAAKASEKRVAAAREAAAAKAAATPTPEAAPEESAPETVRPATAPVATPPVSVPTTEPATTTPAAVEPEKPASAPAAAPAPVSAPAAEPATSAPASVTPEKPAVAPAVPAPPPAKPRMVLPAKTPGSETANASEPAHDAIPTGSTTAEQPASVPAKASVANEQSGPVEAVAAPEPAKTEEPAEPEVSAASTPAPTETVPEAARAPEGSAAPGVEQTNGFYDANKGTNVVTAAPSPEGGTAGFGSAQPAEAAPTATPDARNTAATAMAPPDDPNEERERVVQLGAFAKPREEAPDPEAAEHKTTFLPGDAEGFQEGQRADCTKNITLGSLKGEKLVLGTPGWAAKWIEKNQKRMPQVCFSDTPMQGARNYLIVFYTPPGATGGAASAEVSLTALKDTPASGMGTFTTSYGSTWHYSYDRTVGVTVLTHDEGDEPHSQPGQVLYATAYTEEGVPVTQHWPEKAKKQVKLGSKKPKQIREAREVMEQISIDLLEQMVADIAGL